MTTYFSNHNIDSFVELDTFQTQLTTRIERREQILQIIQDGDLVEGIRQAYEAGLELFDPQQLPLSVLKGQVNAVSKLTQVVDQYEAQIKRLKELESKGKSLATSSDLLEQEVRINRLILYDIMDRAYIALLELNESHLTDLITQANAIIREIGDTSYLATWFRELRADRDFLQKMSPSWGQTSVGHTMSEGTETVTRQDLQAWKTQLLDRQSQLNPQQWKMLNKLTKQQPNSRLLTKYKALHLVFADGERPLAVPSDSSLSLPTGGNVYKLEELLQAYCDPGQSVEQISEKLETVAKDLEHFLGQQNMWKIITLSFFAIWMQWIEQSEHIGKVLTEIRQLLASQPMTRDEKKHLCKPLVNRLNELLITADSVAVYRWHEEYDTIIQGLISLYQLHSEPNKASVPYLLKMGERASKKSSHGDFILKRLSGSYSAPRE